MKKLLINMTIGLSSITGLQAMDVDGWDLSPKEKKAEKLTFEKPILNCSFKKKPPRQLPQWLFFIHQMAKV